MTRGILYVKTEYYETGELSNIFTRHHDDVRRALEDPKSEGFNFDGSGPATPVSIMFIPECTVERTKYMISVIIVERANEKEENPSFDQH